MKKLNHLSEVYKLYDVFIIDLWGVMHNGIELNSNAMKAVENLKKNNKKVIFLSNAPRPSSQVKIFLKKINMKEEYLKNIMTSGEASIHALKNNQFGKNFYHLGPVRDESIFEDFKENRTSLENCDFILCTGLFENKENSLDYYENLLKKNLFKKFICTNPDLIVHRGEIKEYCAGKIAQIFEKIGGKVVYFGKPYKEIYKLCLKENEKVIAIGDNLRTDIKGANNMKIDSIFITSGVHRTEFDGNKNLENLLDKHRVKASYFQEQLYW